MLIYIETLGSEIQSTTCKSRQPAMQNIYQKKTKFSQKKLGILKKISDYLRH